MRLTDHEPKILGLDIENGTRWGWGPNGYTFSIIYCVTTKWFRKPDTGYTYWIDWRLPDHVLQEQTALLWEEMELADKFLGHNFQHDFSGIMGLARDISVPFPAKKPVIDTYKDIPAHKGESSSLDNLCAQFGLGDKPHLPQYDWVQAFIRNRPEYVQKVIARNRADVLLTEALYEKELELGWLS